MKHLTSGAMDGEIAAFVAGALAVQVALAALDLSSDHHTGLMGVLFWLCVASVLATSRDEVRSRRASFRLLAGGAG